MDRRLWAPRSRGGRHQSGNKSDLCVPSRTCPNDATAQSARDCLARRHTAWSVAEAGLGVVSFNSSPERLTVLFTSAPSTFGKRAPSMWVVIVLSASLTNQVPKLATSPIAAALYSSAASAGRLPELNLGRPRAAVIVAYRPLASKIRMPLGLESAHWGCLVPSRVTSHDTSVQVPTSCSLRDFCCANALLESKLRPIAVTAMANKLARLHRFIIVVSFENLGLPCHTETILYEPSGPRLHSF